jgi:hypothetical protein
MQLMSYFFDLFHYVFDDGVCCMYQDQLMFVPICGWYLKFCLSESQNSFDKIVLFTRFKIEINRLTP